MEINNDLVNDLQRYMLHTGILSTSLRLLDELQTVAYHRGLFNDDQIEKAKTIKYEVMRLLTSLNDQINSCTESTGLTWDQLRDQITRMKPTSEQSTPKDRPKKSRKTKTKE